MSDQLSFKVLQEGLMLAERAGNSDVAARFRDQIEKRLRENSGSIAPQDEAQFQLSQVEQNLYLPPPAGYQAAIAALDELSSRPSFAIKDPRFHVFWAAALGQKYAYEKAQGMDDAALRPVIDEALDHIRQARYSGETDWLQYLADPARGAKSPTVDDDLVELAKLPDVRREIGLG